MIRRIEIAQKSKLMHIIRISYCIAKHTQSRDYVITTEMNFDSAKAFLPNSRMIF